MEYKFSLNVKEVLTVMKPMATLINSSAVLPILECALFQFKGRILTISVTNLENFIKATITLPNEHNIDFCVDYKLFTQALENCEQEQIEIVVSKGSSRESKEGQLLIKGNDFKIKMPTEDANHYVQPPKVTELKSTFEIETKRLFKSLKNSISTVSNDDLRPAMTGIQLSIYNKKFTVCSTDAHRLFFDSIEPVREDTKNVRCIINTKFADLIQKSFKAEKVSVDIDDKFIVMYNDTYWIAGRLVDAKFPDWAQLIDGHMETTFVHSFVMKRKQMSAVIKLALPYLNRSTNQIQFKIGKDGMEFCAEEVDYSMEFYYKAPVYENTMEEASIVNLWFNAKFIQETLKLSTDENVKIQFHPIKIQSPVLIDGCMLIMPVMPYNAS